MRKLEEIQSEIIQAVQNDEILSAELTSTSKVAIWRLWTYVFAFVLWLHEQVVERNAENSRPHTRQWYRETALAFMDGLPLKWVDGRFDYDLTGLTEQQIEDLKAVKHVAITEAANGVLIIKTAGSNNEPLAPSVHTRFKSYMGQIKDAGNRLDFINQPADELELHLKVWVDDLFIDSGTGETVNEPGSTPIEDACDDYLNSLEFDGSFVKTFLIDRLQKVEGVKVPTIVQLKHRTAGGSWADADEFTVPFSGHFKYTVINIDFAV